MTTVFGIDPSQVRVTAQALDGEVSVISAVAQDVAASVPSAASLPGGRTLAALVDGAGQVAAAVGGEARVVDVLGGDLRSFAAVVDSAEQDATVSLEGAR
ncbi:hypothetical protein PQI66_10180 [Corynebacterium sp. USCH3]|uniref:hypothetical protein n=1 Tax=Corynebacterium sp. USCH3 TaxID=3024840 RepID=UPI003098947D